MICKDILNLAAIIISPVVAVLIGQWLQNRVEKRKDKMQIFKSLMIARIYGWTVDSVHSLNLINVVFSKDKKVRSAWKDLLDAYSSTEYSDLMNDKRNKLMYKLIEKIAQNLGYDKEIKWDDIQNSYMPEGLNNQLKTQSHFQKEQTELLSNINKTMFKPSSEETK